jgi:hypothetical protein
VLPGLVVLVNDGVSFNPNQIKLLRRLLSPIPVVITGNRRTRGAAGTWNTGLDEINRVLPDAFVAILDDDDTWDADHLKINAETAIREDADIVISGLRLIRDGLDIPRPHVNRLCDRDFLVGNPGWQGSNTFVSMSLMRRVGGFRDGLKSMNDRDLAIRLLRVEGVRVSYTGVWTSSWFIRSDNESLSAFRSEPKLSGLRWFWILYGAEMSGTEASLFFARALNLFDFEKEEILNLGDTVPPELLQRGDFNAD